jgi:AbrB family looped-hinge helix DNA binding protein
MMALMDSRSHVMTVSRNGQVSIPAEVRARWKARQVVVVDLGDRVVVRPLTDRPVDAVRGKYAGRGPRSDRARAQARSEAAARERSR